MDLGLTLHLYVSLRTETRSRPCPRALNSLPAQREGAASGRHPVMESISGLPVGLVVSAGFSRTFCRSPDTDMTLVPRPAPAPSPSRCLRPMCPGVPCLGVHPAHRCLLARTWLPQLPLRAGLCPGEPLPPRCPQPTVLGALQGAGSPPDIPFLGFLFVGLF